MNVLWIDFVNSNEHDHLGRAPDADRLDDPGWVRAFLRKHGLPPIELAGPSALRDLKSLRRLLQEIALDCVARRSLRDPQIAALNRYLAGPPVRPVLLRERPAYRLHLSTTSRGQAAVQFEIAASFARFLVDGAVDRLKICENANCRWFFYDATRSRTKRWCAANCGNLVKVRRFRLKRSRLAARRPARTSHRQKKRGNLGA